MNHLIQDRKIHKLKIKKNLKNRISNPRNNKIIEIEDFPLYVLMINNVQKNELFSLYVRG